MKVQIIFLLCFILALSNIAVAQPVKVINDFRFRTFIEAGKDINKKFSVFAETELALEQNITRMGRTYIGAGVIYAPVKFLEFETKYRYTKNRKNYSENYKNTHRIAVSGVAKHRVDRFRLSYRLQYQNIDDDASWSGVYETNRNVLKNRLRVKYNVRKSPWAPYASTELYLLNTNKIHGFNPSKLKSIAGIEYVIKGHGKAKFYYRNDKELVNYMPYTYHTFGLGYVFSL